MVQRALRKESKYMDMIRQLLAEEVNSDPTITPENLEESWTTEQVREQFEVIGFMAPFVVVRRKSDGVMGSLMFKHSPRVYFGWQAD